MYKCIIHATDLKENHFEICKKSTEIAKIFGATLHLLHVIELPTSLQLAQGLGFTELTNPSKDDATTVLATLGDAMAIPSDRQHVEIGSLKMHLLEKVKTLHCDLIILGNHQSTTLQPFLGSANYTTLHHAPCDVLTLRTELLP